MTVSGGAAGGGLGVGGVAVGGVSGAGGVTAALANTGAGHVADSIVFGIVLLTGGLAVLGVARRPRRAGTSTVSPGSKP